jgi:host factor-I protein
MSTSEQNASAPPKDGAADTRIQEPYLNQLRKARRNVVIYLLSGVRLTGRIASFDQHFIALQGVDLQVINKDAIASIMPGPPMSAKRAPPRGAGSGNSTGYVPRNPAPTPRANVVVTTRVSRRPRPI